MIRIRYTVFTVLASLFLCQITVLSYGQEGMTLDIKKPKEYENRILRSEKSDKKKFTAPRRFVQNTVTHYNYVYNANVKLKEVLARAKESFTDDYSQLIPFYNYTLDATAADSVQLDSISYKSQTGIVLHDLRSNWTDNLYLLWGASYYLKKQFDSAYMMFQFINYAYAEKEKDGYYKYIGSPRDGNNAASVSTPEKNSFFRRVLSEPPSRNDAFIWQIRTYLAQEKLAAAASLIEILKNDPKFPPRLHNDLEEMQAWSFYIQKQWDSCAVHLEKALSNAGNKQEKARWEYLLGQLYEMSGKYAESEMYYTKAIGHTTDLIMEVYARLFAVRVNKDGGENYIAKNIETLAKMARRDKYYDYRDIIYYMAAQMELERNNIDGALGFLLKCTKSINDNPSLRNKAFLQLAELSFSKRKYRQAYNFYDSLNLQDPEIKDPEAITARKDILARAADNFEIIERQDSLQRIAALPEDERRELTRKMARHIRRQQGLKDDGSFTTGSALTQTAPAPSLFNETKKGEWYFYNNNSRQKGLAEFKSRWGTRPNVDNWRRGDALAAVVRTQNTANQAMYPGSNIPAKIDTTAPPQEITFDILYESLPLSPEKMQASNDSIRDAMHALGLIYVQELEDCNAGIETFEKERFRFPDNPKMDEVLFNLYHCYTKTGETAKAAEIKKLMSDKFPSSNFTTIVTTGKNPRATGRNEEATKKYSDIYDLFLEGKFAQAIAEKKVADSMYSKNYWTPQLLYIESVYYIKQREDSAARNVLNNIIAQFSGTPLAEKSKTMLDVLSRRQQIEEELRNLKIEPQTIDTTTRYRPSAPAPVIHPPVVINQPQDSTVNNAVTNPPVQPADSTIARNITGNTPVTRLPGDSSGIRPGINDPGRPSITGAPRVTVSNQPRDPNAFYFNATEPHYVVVILNKVDPIYVSEARNAFYRYNRDTYYNVQMQAELVDIDSVNRIVLISPFKTAQEAVDYVDRTKPRTATEILPWLRGGKYSFSVISARNLEILRSNKEIDKYVQFIEEHFPGKF